MKAAARRRVVPPLLLLVVVLVAASLPAGLCQTNSQDVSALQSLMSQWKNTPSSWSGNDPCGARWDGIMCNNARVTSLRLSSVNLQGTLSNNIGQLSQLVYLDLSFNIGLGGPMPASIGNLAKLTTLILAGCSFTGDIPQELGNLLQLSFLALNSNKFTGKIPASLGLLSNLYWLDLADNQLTGTIPVSTATTPGLDLLTNTKHFHFNKNQLSGTLTGLFNSNMTLIHILFDSNQLSGSIPAELGGVATLQVLRLDRNNFGGAIPPTISNLTNLNELNLASNQLTGSLPDLSQMSKLNVVYLSNNSFSASVVPNWFTTLTSLTSVSIAYGQLSGGVPKGLFTLPQIQQVELSNNALNGTIEITGSINKQLKSVNLQNNRIIATNVTPSYNSTLVLVGNPVCVDPDFAGRSFCSVQQENLIAYTTSLAKCASTAQCSNDQSQNPANCGCAYPYTGKMVFRAPFFTDLTNSDTFQQLETSFTTQLALRDGSAYLSDIHFNSDNYLQVQVKLFPSSGMTFNTSELIRIGFDLSNQTFKPPSNYGPYYFIADPYLPLSGAAPGVKKSQISTGAIAGIAVAGGLLVLALIGMVLFALRQKQRAKEITERTDPFASWGVSQKDSGGAPQLKGARFFTIEELKNSTNNFSDEIGSGGYGKVYKGTLGDGTRVAIKRAEPGSMQGVVEFKNEIELLSRVHHRNLVSLIGFCYQQGEQMLVYEYISNGTLRENLIVRGTYLDWKKRLRIALGSARGLAYLHELADPPIIHRDIKSTNILLDDSLKAKVADFGLSKLVADTQKGHVSTQVKGTLGYLDPEYYMTQQLSEKSDVYSFGVVMLELVSGRQPIEAGKYIVREVKLAIDPNDRDHYGLRSLLDPAIRDAARTAGFRRFVQLAMRCVDESAAVRPSMGEVVKEIEAMLQNEAEGAGSAGSSANEFDGAGGGARAHPYSDVEITRSSYGGDNVSDYMPYFEVKPK
ncbi:hypothetical protein EJB05_36127 [Eragrostis curvula]|uniref:non-specific serine/threonine protein kinase n=1 Tax=Eragrostis curvula TaxID=38414 RepID=A0A5J9U8X8_9POAL|nr:hypothetical protein EJB05_36127 [Eragrostis curvula]